MKILHAADLHLDTPFTGRPEAELRYLKKALLTVPEQIAGLCRLHGCDLLLLAGDLFDGPASRESLDALKAALADIRIPVFISPGNHDFCGAGSPWLEEHWPENVTVFRGNLESVAVAELAACVLGIVFIIAKRKKFGY
jgi:DNA repair exonuclease SbcCD nuclease subunit